MRRLTDGDSEAGDHFAEYFGNALYLKLRVRLRSSQSIEDVRQETLARVLKALRREGGLKSPDRLPAFVNGVCNHVVMELYRRDSHEQPWDEKTDEPIDPKEDLDAALVSSDLKLAIAQVFAGLVERDRRILQAIYVDEIPREELCEMFAVDAEYLRVLVHRARQHFRNAYKSKQKQSISRGEG